MSRYQTRLLSPGQRLVDQHGRELDEQGRVILTSGKAIRGWFMTEGKANVR